MLSGTFSTMDIGLFVSASFIASLVAGLAGFAFGLIAAALWLHMLSPSQTTVLIGAYGLVVQGLAVWHVRHAIRAARLGPILLGAMFGVPLGAVALRSASADVLRVSVGIILVLFSTYSLSRLSLSWARSANPAAEAGVGLASGALGAATGLGGILPVIWCNLRGGSKDEQRAVFQPTAVVIFFATLAWLGGFGEIDTDTLFLLAVGLPPVIAGTWAGLRLYGRLDEAAFRNVVLWLLLISGAVLILR
jgi:uncharacterized membrane protein YfcA